VGGDAGWKINARRRPGCVGASDQPRPGERAHHACGRDLADSVVVVVGYIDIARAVGGNAAWEIKARRGPGSVGAAGDARRTRECGDRAPGRALADGVVAGIGHIDITRGVGGNAWRAMHARRGPGHITVSDATL